MTGKLIETETIYNLNNEYQEEIKRLHERLIEAEQNIMKCGKKNEDNDNYKQKNIDINNLTLKKEIKSTKEIFSIITINDEVFATAINTDINFININTYNIENRLVGHKDRINTMIKVDTKIFSGSADGYIIKWDINTNKKIKEIKAHDKSIRKILNYLNNIISGSHDITIKIWNIENLEQMHLINIHKSPVCDMIIPSNLNNLFSFSQFDIILIYDLKNNTQIKKINEKIIGCNITSMGEINDLVFIGSFNYIILMNKFDYKFEKKIVSGLKLIKFGIILNKTNIIIGGKSGDIGEINIKLNKDILIKKKEISKFGIKSLKLFGNKLIVGYGEILKGGSLSIYEY